MKKFIKNTFWLKYKNFIQAIIASLIVFISWHPHIYLHPITTVILIIACYTLHSYIESKIALKKILHKFSKQEKIITTLYKNSEELIVYRDICGNFIVKELFDKKIKELVQGFEEPADGALWSSIGSELARIRRIKFIKRISAYAASAAAVVVGIWLFVNPLDRDELGASPSDLAVAEKEFVAEEVDIVTVVPDIEEIVADNYQP